MGNEWALVFFTTFVCLGAGTFVAVGTSEWWEGSLQLRQHGAIAALVALATGGFSSVLHLGHPGRIFGALGHPTSGIFMESLTIGLTGLCVIAYLVALLRGAQPRVRKSITVVGALLAAALAFAVGDTYVMSSRPAWDTLTLPLVYLASAGVFGCLSLRALVAGRAGDAPPWVKFATLVALGIQALLLVAYLAAVAVAPYPQADRAVLRVLAGDLAPQFWLGVVLLGLLVPLVLALRKRAVPSPLTLALGGLLCTFTGAVAFRSLMFRLGSSVWHFF